METEISVRNSIAECEFPGLQCNDIGLLENEKFDFDLPISPDFGAISSRGSEEDEIDEDDEDEVFFGPVGHKEQCAQAVVELQKDAEVKPLSPLNSEQFVELFKEAATVALHIKNSTSTDQPGNEITLNPQVVKLMHKDIENKENGPDTKLKENTNSVESVLVRKNFKERPTSLPLTTSGSENKLVSESKGQLKQPTKMTSKLESIQRSSKNSMIAQRKGIPRTGIASRLPKTQAFGKSRSEFSSPIKSSIEVITQPTTAKENVSANGPQHKALPSNLEQHYTPKKYTNTSQLRRSVIPPATTRSNKDESSTAQKDKPTTTTASKLRPPSNTGLAPPGFSTSRHRRTSSSSSTSSTSSATGPSATEKEPKDDKTNSVQQSQSTRPRIKSSLTTFGSCIAKPNIRPSARTSGLAKPMPVRAIPQSARKSDSSVTEGTAPVTGTPQHPSTPNRRRSGIPMPGSQQAVGGIPRPRTPSRSRKENSCATPIMSVKSKEAARKRNSMSAGCVKRRSLIPPPSIRESPFQTNTSSRKLLLQSPTREITTLQQPTLESLDLATPPPEPVGKFDSASSVLMRAKELLGKTPVSKEVNNGEVSLQNEQKSVEMESDSLPVVKENVITETKSTEEVKTSDVPPDATSILEMSPSSPDEMIKLDQLPVPSSVAKLKSDLVDPFSLGKDSPALSNAATLLSAVLTPELKYQPKDLIDLSNTPADQKECLIDLNDELPKTDLASIPMK